MKTLLHFFVILLFSIFLFSCNCDEPNSYAHELCVISNPRIYEKIVEEKPEKRMVDLETFIPNIVLDIRYATKNNFTGSKIYKEKKAFLRQAAAEALIKVQNQLNAQGLGLKIFDAYRPYAATVKFYQVYPDTNFVAAPWRGSKHNRGCAVDVTIIDLETKKELAMPTAFDAFTEKASQNYNDLPDTLLKNRELLRNTMTENGFSTIPNEWWHYDFEGWENFELLDISFADLQ